MTVSMKNNHKRSISERIVRPYEILALVAVLFTNSPVAEAFVSTSPRSKFYPGTYSMGGYGNTQSTYPATTTTVRLERLQFQNGNEEDIKFNKGHNNNKGQETVTHSRWWGTLRPASPRNEVDEESRDVDEYLKFLDKRHHQIHDEPAPLSMVQQEPRKSPFLRWLNKDDVDFHPGDALYALASVARSAEVLEKKQQKPASEERKITKDGVDEAEDNSPIHALVLSLKKSRVYQKITGARQALLRYQTLKLRQISSVVWKAFKSIPLAPSLLLKAGGGRKPLGVAIAVLSVVLFQVVFPSISAILKESAASKV